MNIQELIAVVNNKIYFMEDQKRKAAECGNIDLTISIENDIANTKITLNKLETL